jgi:hypothetical protein
MVAEPCAPATAAVSMKYRDRQPAAGPHRRRRGATRLRSHCELGACETSCAAIPRHGLRAAGRGPTRPGALAEYRNPACTLRGQTLPQGHAASGRAHRHPPPLYQLAALLPRVFHAGGARAAGPSGGRAALPATVTVRRPFQARHAAGENRPPHAPGRARASWITTCCAGNWRTSTPWSRCPTS